jgi:hypothetical protein
MIANELDGIATDEATNKRDAEESRINGGATKYNEHPY